MDDADLLGHFLHTKSQREVLKRRRDARLLVDRRMTIDSNGISRDLRAAPSLLDVGLRDGHSPAEAKRAARYLDSRCGLLAFVFV